MLILDPDATYPAEFQPVVDLVQRLRDAGVRADVDLEDVPVPGVWVRLTQVGAGTMTGAEVGLELVCLTEETAASRAYPALIDLHNSLDDHLGGLTDQPARFVTVSLPGGASVPGLAIPFNLL